MVIFEPETRRLQLRGQPRTCRLLGASPGSLFTLDAKTAQRTIYNRESVTVLGYQVKSFFWISQPSVGANLSLWLSALGVDACSPGSHWIRARNSAGGETDEHVQAPRL